MKSESSVTQPETAVSYRIKPVASDRAQIAAITEATGFFYEVETAVAVELIDIALAKGEASDYRFVFAESADEMLGYVCYGHIACTLHSYDIYWIVVAPGQQGKGLGRALLERSEALIRELSGRQSYIETSARALYLPTRGFYLRCGYEEVARLADFYGPDDDKVIYRKLL